MTYDTLKEACDKINVSLNDDLLFYLKKRDNEIRLKRINDDF